MAIRERRGREECNIKPVDDLFNGIWDLDFNRYRNVDRVWLRDWTLNNLFHDLMDGHGVILKQARSFADDGINVENGKTWSTG